MCAVCMCRNHWICVQPEIPVLFLLSHSLRIPIRIDCVEIRFCMAVWLLVWVCVYHCVVEVSFNIVWWISNQINSAVAINLFITRNQRFFSLMNNLEDKCITNSMSCNQINKIRPNESMRVFVENLKLKSQHTICINRMKCQLNVCAGIGFSGINCQIRFRYIQMLLLLCTAAIHAKKENCPQNDISIATTTPTTIYVEIAKQWNWTSRNKYERLCASAQNCKKRKRRQTYLVGSLFESNGTQFFSFRFA